jgi:hypothetical protein
VIGITDKPSKARSRSLPALPCSERIRIEALDPFDLLRRQRGELVLAGAPGEPPVVLPQEAEQVVERALRHIDDRPDACPEAVEGFEEARFLRQVVLDRLPDTGM